MFGTIILSTVIALATFYGIVGMLSEAKAPKKHSRAFGYGRGDASTDSKPSLTITRPRRRS